jgi:hypothetical protein
MMHVVFCCVWYILLNAVHFYAMNGVMQCVWYVLLTVVHYSYFDVHCMIAGSLLPIWPQHVAVLHVR